MKTPRSPLYSVLVRCVQCVQCVQYVQCVQCVQCWPASSHLGQPGVVVAVSPVLGVVFVRDREHADLVTLPGWDGLTQGRVLSERQNKIRSKFWTLKNRYYHILFLCFFSFLSYNFSQQILFAKKKNSNTSNIWTFVSGGPENLRLNYVLYNFGLYFGQNLFLQAKFFANIFIWSYLSS